MCVVGSIRVWQQNDTQYIDAGGNREPRERVSMKEEDNISATSEQLQDAKTTG